MATTTEHQIKNPALVRTAQLLWIVAALFNLIIFSIGIIISYQRASNGGVQFDIHVERVPDSAYVVWDHYETEDYNEEYWRVTEVSDAAAEAGLRVGDLMRIHWGQGLENMSIPIRVQSEGKAESQITLIASDLDEGFIVTFVSPDAEAAGIRLGDIMYGDYIPWQGEIGSGITFMVIHEGEMQPEAVTLTRKPDLYAIKTLTDLGLPINGAALIDASLVVIVILMSFAMAVLVFVNRPHNWMAMLFAWILTLPPTVVAYTDFTPFLYEGAYWNLFETAIGFVAIIALLIFPTGRLYPRWSLLLAFAAIAINSLLPGLPGNSDIWNALIFILLLLLIVYRYRSHFSLIQRQQTKWVIYAFSLLMLTQVIFIPGDYLGHIGGTQLEAIYILVFGRFVNTVLLLTAIVLVAFAILRYRLYDIDIVINRSLVGAIVTIVLLIIFVASVFLIQGVLGAENTLVSFIVSAAIPAFVFNPTRKRVRQFIDRYIYGFRFDLNELHQAQKAHTILNPGALTGQILGDYEVRGLIGKGGMGEVYQGFGQEQIVAVKTMLSEIAKDNDMRTRFQRETEAGKTLEHPNIARVFASGMAGDTPYIIMEYIEGQDLRSILKRDGAFDEETTIQIIQDICSALDMAHAQGFVHRDLKPANIMLRENGEAVLMDFGVTKVKEARTITGTGAIGTIDYMAPEQIMSAKTVDHRADIYALGILAYELLTGEKPFKGSAAQIMFAHIQQPPPSARDVKPDIPQQIAQAIEKALAKDPDERFASAGDFAQALII